MTDSRGIWVRAKDKALIIEDGGKVGLPGAVPASRAQQPDVCRGEGAYTAGWAR